MLAMGIHGHSTGTNTAACATAAAAAATVGVRARPTARFDVRVEIRESDLCITDGALHAVPHRVAG